MTTSFYIRRLLSPEDLEKLTDYLAHAEWSKSRDKIPEYLSNRQTNSEMVAGILRNEISKTIFAKIDADQGFRDRVFPRNSTDLIVSRSEVGEGFYVHLDTTSVGEFSTTVFLSDPDTYKGGELCLYLEDEVRKFKLPAGTAITYTTGAPHCVSKVTSGVRHAGVFWTSSLVKDVRYREILSDIRQVRRLLPIKTTYDLEETATNPEFILQGVEHKLIRHFL
jgi:PKHD-type hydroxylase